MSTSPGSQDQGKSTPWVAVISVVGVLGGALLYNWDKVFPRTAPQVPSAPTAAASAASAALPPPQASAAAQPAPVVIAKSCAPAVKSQDTQSGDIVVGLKCSQTQTDRAVTGPDYVSEMSVDEFIDHAIRNSKLIDSYLLKVKGSTEVEAAANFHNMRSVVEFAEFLGMNLNNLRTYAGTNPAIHRSIEHGERLDQYRAQLSRLQ